MAYVRTYVMMEIKLAPGSDEPKTTSMEHWYDMGRNKMVGYIHNFPAHVTERTVHLAGSAKRFIEELNKRPGKHGKRVKAELISVKIADKAHRNLALREGMRSVNNLSASMKAMAPVTEGVTFQMPAYVAPADAAAPKEAEPFRMGPSIFANAAAARAANAKKNANANAAAAAAAAAKMDRNLAELMAGLSVGGSAAAGGGGENMLTGGYRRRKTQRRHKKHRRTARR